MYLNGFSVRVVGGIEKQDGYIEMEHDQHYSLILRNSTNKRCDAKVEIDGKEIGVFRIEAHDTFRLERPANEAKKFTFYKSGSFKASEAGERHVAKVEKGLVQVTFMPEKWVQHVVRKDCPYYDWIDSWKHRQHRKYRRIGGWQKSWDKNSTISTDSNIPYGACNTGNVDMHDEESLGTPLGNMEGGTQSSATAPMFRDKYVDPIADTDAEFLCMDDSVTHSRVDYKADSGVTGLSGHSDQSFHSVPELCYDEEAFVTINLRLVAVENGVSELKPITKGNPVPPPIRRI